MKIRKPFILSHEEADILLEVLRDYPNVHNEDNYDPIPEYSELSEDCEKLYKRLYQWTGKTYETPKENK